jgi:pimeloyl-ACP methyl ester carboxylesterase
MPHRTRPYPRPLHLLFIAAIVLCALLAAEPAGAQDAVLPGAAPPLTITPSLSLTIPPSIALAITATAVLTPSLAADPFAGLLDAESPVVARIEYTATFAEVECPFIVPWNQQITCGELEVPENRTDIQSDGVSLFVVILKSLSRPELDPILVIPDGPGREGTSLRRLFYSSAGAPFRINRDIILFDPRGAGYSSPSLACPEVRAAQSTGAAQLAAYHACHARLLDAGRDLSAYTSATEVADIVDLAQTLGIGSLNIYATGYGTQIAVLLADSHPNLVRSMVLDGVLPVDANALLEGPLNLYTTLQRVAQDCSTTPACNAAYPALEARLLEVIDRYTKTPAPLGYGSGDDIFALMINRLAQGGDLLPAFITALFDEDLATACLLLPPNAGCATTLENAAPFPANDRAPDDTSGAAPWHMLLPDAANPGGPQVETVTWLMRTLGYAQPGALFAHLDSLTLEEVSALLDEAPAPAAETPSEGLTASVFCAEDAPFYTRADLRHIAGRIPRQFGLLPLEQAALMQAVCIFWRATPVARAEMLIQPILAPVLIVNGAHDAQTPPTWARRAAAGMERAEVQLFPGDGHALLASGDTCLPAMMQVFYAAPGANTRAACTSALTLDFVLPGDELLP